MTHDELISLLQQSDQIEVKYVSELKDLMLSYPYFGTIGLMYTKSLAQSQSVKFGSFCKITSLYTANRSWFYYYLHPEKSLSAGRYRKVKSGKSSGDYFDMIETLESQGENNKNTLKNLADRLKSARTLAVQVPLVTEVIEPDDILENAINQSSDLGYISINQLVEFDVNVETASADLLFELEAQAKKLISERKFSAAIDILRKLNLNNPKKSVYFADQIRFLEKIVENTKKII